MLLCGSGGDCAQLCSERRLLEPLDSPETTVAMTRRLLPVSTTAVKPTTTETIETSEDTETSAYRRTEPIHTYMESCNDIASCISNNCSTTSDRLAPEIHLSPYLSAIQTYRSLELAEMILRPAKRQSPDRGNRVRAQPVECARV